MTLKLRIATVTEVELDEETLAALADALWPHLPRSGSLPLSPYMTTDEAAEYARCSRQRIYDLVSQGRLARYKDGARTLVLRDELDAYLRGSRPGRGERAAAA